jgi:hypothetical protein
MGFALQQSHRRHCERSEATLKPYVGLQGYGNAGMENVSCAALYLVCHTKSSRKEPPPQPRHCEERSDAAIHSANARRLALWIAASACGLLAMTG